MSGMEIKMCVVKSWNVCWNEAAECFQVIFHSAVSFTLCPHLRFCRIYIQSTQLYISFIANWRSMSVCICAQMSYSVRCFPVLCKSVFCMCMYVCQCVLSKLISSATKCCYVLLLFSCCHRNTVVAKPLLLLPCYLISCSLFPQWLRIGLSPFSHNTSSPYRLLTVLQQQPALDERSSHLRET